MCQECQGNETLCRSITPIPPLPPIPHGTIPAPDAPDPLTALTVQGSRFEVQGSMVPLQPVMDVSLYLTQRSPVYGIVKCGLPREMMVSFGWPSQIPNKRMTTMDAVDRGRTRSVGDQLTIQHGLPNGKLIASVSAELANLCCIARIRRLSVGNTLEVFHEFEKPLLWTVENRSKQKGLRSAGVLAAFTLAMAGYAKPADPNRHQLEAWHKSLNAGNGLQTGGSLARLHTFLTGKEEALFTPGMNRGLALLTCQALYMEVNHLPGKSLTMVETGAAHWKSLQPDRISRLAKIFEL